MKNVPTDQELYRRVIAEAKKKFDVYPSAYANGWVVQEYKRRGGTYRVEKADGGLKEWFKEKWVDISRPKEGGGFEPCGRPDADKGGDSGRRAARLVRAKRGPAARRQHGQPGYRRQIR